MTSEEIDHYLARGFSIDCPHMSLRQDVGTSPDVYEGPGSIYQTPEGELAFKFYGGTKANFRALDRLVGSGAPTVGQIIPQDQYFRLEATSMRGERWFGERILPDVNQGVGGDQVITGRLYELTKRVNDPRGGAEKAHMSLSFADDFDFPGNTPRSTKTFLRDEQISFSGDWSSAVFEAEGLQFAVHKHRGTVLLLVSSKGEVLPADLDMRICEALEFTLFVPARWVVREASENGRYASTLRPFPKTNAKQSAHPPIKFNSAPLETAPWKLFAKYLEYVLRHSEPRRHPLSEDVHDVVTGDAGSLDFGLLALSVSVEGALTIGFPNLATPEDGLLEQISAAENLVSLSELESSFKKRLKGSLAAMRAPRAKDKLHALVGLGLIRKELADCWTSIRNSTVHASDIDPAEISDLYRRYQSTLTLFNELVMLIVGYTGEYTDYSALGWPRRHLDRQF